MNYITLLMLLLSAQIQAAEESVESKPAAPVIPGNEILLFDIQQDATGIPMLSKGINITNQPGYDSQPRFSNDGKTLYYTHAVVTASAMQMDIYQYDITTGNTSPYLTTELSEYSPTPMPHQPGLSVVQVDEKGDQYLVLLNSELKADKPNANKVSQRYSDLTQVGYFNWIQAADESGYDAWSFILNDNNGGDLYQQGSGLKAAKVSQHVGRSFITDSQHKTLYYVDKNSTPWRIKARTADAAHSTDVMPLPMGVEDFTLDSQGRFWAGRDNTLFVSSDQKRWFIVAEFNDPSLHQITRVTTNPLANKIAIVFAEKTASE